MDVEDWYHTYFPEMDVDRSQSLLDGLDVALDIMDKKNIKGSFFVVGELAIEFLTDITAHISTLRALAGTFKLVAQ